ncbi:MAG: ribosomal protein S18-alanine N-acetyltransferase [Firmicutes bacterium]|nr:ribosomal protein S18-alanine N-acetyltransferase [Bacillota bacterium]MBQ1959385.1 ribosomal protein S18-alanine N-acetyltransferase [Bacillota bacterium]
MADLVIRRGEEKDILAIEELEKQCFATPWSYESLKYDIVENNRALYLVAEIEGEIVGYVGIWKIVDEGHITNVAVSPAHRRKHIASALLETLFRVTERAGVVQHTLEVRAGNEGAIKLYEGFGFKEAGLRKGYYEDNGEDAIIMWR